MATKEKPDLYFKIGEMHSDIKSILVEAKRTNGRITKLESETVPALEKRVDQLEIKLAKYIGGAAVIIFVLQLLLPRLMDKFI